MSLLSLVFVALSGSAYAEAPGISTTVEQATTATPKEMATNAAEMMGEITGAVSTVDGLLKAAEGEKKKNEELIKCLKDKLPQLQTIAQVSGEVDQALKAELAVNGAQSGPKYRQLVVLHGRAKELLIAAQQCAKGTAGDPGTSTASVTGGSDGVKLDEEGLTDISPEFSPS